MNETGSPATTHGITTAELDPARRRPVVATRSRGERPVWPATVPGRCARAVAIAALAVAALTGTASPAAAQLQVEDRTFLLYALSVDLTQVQIGQLAVEKAQNERLRDFARQMVDYHQRSRDRLTSIAQANGLEPPQELDPVSQRWQARLQKATGPQFDAGYMAGQAIYLYAARYSYRRERLQGRDEQLREDASRQALDIDEHRRMLRELAPKSPPTPAAGQAASTELHPEDRTFLLYALDVDKTQIELNQMALGKARNEQVREFARAMLDYHQQSYDRLAGIARQNGIEPPDQIAPMARQIAQGLQQLSGPLFDWEYIATQVINYYWAFYRYEREAIHGRNGRLRDVAAQSSRDVKSHHDSAFGIVRQWTWARAPEPSPDSRELAAAAPGGNAR